MSDPRSLPRPRRVSLTFDDGPSPATTPQLLDHLDTCGVKATFFVIGRKAAEPDGRALIERIAAAGHQLGNHSHTHCDLTKLSAAQIETEITTTESVIGALDHGVKLFRPPFGFRNDTVAAVAKALGYRLVMWNVCALDWRRFYSNRRWVAHAMRQIRARQDCVVLAHDVFPATVTHVPELVAQIKRLPATEFVLLA
jgi:peptidoglycan/xylan/chitin deacetylase (PgdA/CDA1 family)